ncbi:hypothetical protein D3C75_1200480 [compost metagenome]
MGISTTNLTELCSFFDLGGRRELKFSANSEFGGILTITENLSGLIPTKCGLSLLSEELVGEIPSNEYEIEYEVGQDRQVDR